MANITFFPLGNADSSLVELNNGKVVLIDYADKKDRNDPDDKRVDLPKELNSLVAKQDFDVVCFTHLDDDHIKGSSEYFNLWHAQKYQSDDRKEINELWVPASAILEEKCEDEARIIQAEAKHRFREGKGIKVFSKPKKLREWCEKQGISFEDRRHLIVDAGKVVNTFSFNVDGVEFFAQSPFVSHIGETKIDRNSAAITLHLTFGNSNNSKVILGSDIDWQVWEDIIKVTRAKGNEERLEWNIFHISHHCSYTALSEEKGNNKTTPTDSIKWLFEEKRLPGSYIVSPSKSIPAKGSNEDNDNNPPHRQTANYYKETVEKANENFRVTMEFPSISNPKPMVFEVTDSQGVKLIKESAPLVGGGSFGIRKPPRAG